MRHPPLTSQKSASFCLSFHQSREEASHKGLAAHYAVVVEDQRTGFLAYQVVVTVAQRSQELMEFCRLLMSPGRDAVEFEECSEAQARSRALA